MRYLLPLLLLMTVLCHAQTDPVLDAYLATHRYPIKVEADSSTSFADNTLPELIDRKMQDKKLFVYGDGFSHMLNLNSYLSRMFVRHLLTHGLKYHFGESARSWAVRDAIYYRTPDAAFEVFYPGYPAFSREYYRREKALHAQYHYEYVGIDFERARSFARTMSLLLADVDKNNLPALYQLAPYLRDTASFTTLSPKEFVKFYKQQQENFYRDSNNYKTLMGAAYADFRYLIGDTKPSTYQDNRNKNMAYHILERIGEPLASDIYYLNLGIAHTRRGKKDGTSKSTVTFLEDSPQLAGKILITQLYCENCVAEASQWGTGDNWALDFMKGQILASFSKAADSDIVLFDLSELPKGYEYIRNDYCDFLVFAKGQH